LKIAYQYPDKWGSGRQASATLAIQQTGARNDLLHHWRTIAAGTHQETNHAPCASVPKSTENESNAAAAAGAADPKTAICDSARASINDSWWPHLVAAVEEQLGEDGRHDVVYDIVRVMTFQGIFSM
jgi:hypothetical protein